MFFRLIDRLIVHDASWSVRSNKDHFIFAFQRPYYLKQYFAQQNIIIQIFAIAELAKKI